MVEQTLEAWLTSIEVAYDGLYRRYSGLFEQKSYTGHAELLGDVSPMPAGQLPYEAAKKIVHALKLKTLKQWKSFLFSKSSDKWCARTVCVCVCVCVCLWCVCVCARARVCE